VCQRQVVFSYFECKDEGAADDADDETTQPLQNAFQSFANARAEAPVGAENNEPGDEPLTAAADDEDSEMKSQLHHLVVNKRKDNQKFIPFKNWEKQPWAEKGKATAIFQTSKFATTAVSDADTGKQHKLMIFSPALFQCKVSFGSATTF